MASVALLWQMNIGLKFQHLQMVAATVPASIQSLLESSDIHMSRPVQTLEKISRLIVGGADRLSVISDFDHTLSLAVGDDGTVLPVTHQVLGDALVLPDLNQKATQEKYAAYSKESSGSDKLAMLEAWWRKAHDGVVARGLTLKEFEERARQTDIRLRDSSAELLQALSNSGVPTLVFSAGLSDAISFVLRRAMGGIPDGVHIVGNEMEFDEQGKLIAFKTPLLHPFNKNASVIDKCSPLHSSLSTRPHLLVLGDSLCDLTMDKGLAKERDNTLRIGFLNGQSDKLAQFLQGYDIVIATNQSIEIPRRIVEEIVGAK
ncbi:hypothetical protein PRIPAC_92096 [Pristionchus pacificus]|uniref:5'-nucleotidase n=1 Tax=Pristionchus pacificus TaxID=54126 RepID=A0A2A6CDQ7_PRIPA|nr:hypothetical protein PRIPAC_92096 [Pristionchus pacificus]|eukprot:PDM76334.1 hypothetical protein PRIPAC_39938 [Pristionchus pacificus]